MARTFRELKVWQRAHEFVLEVYKITKDFPAGEKFGLVNQIRRSSASVATNIVEGHKRKSDKEFSRFLNLSESSLEETKYHLLLAKDLTYIDETEYQRMMGLAEEVGRMLFGFQRKLT